MLGRIAEASWRKTFCVSNGKKRTNEAAVLGLAGEIVEPISKGDGVLVVEEDGAVRVEKLA
jgi:hypothetical protein